MSDKNTSVDIVHGDSYIRSYNQEDHGDDFMSLATNFAADHEHEVVPSDQIVKVRVGWREFDKKANNGEGRYVSRSQEFEDKQAALDFSHGKPGSSITVVRVKKSSKSAVASTPADSADSDNTEDAGEASDKPKAKSKKK